KTSRGLRGRLTLFVRRRPRVALGLAAGIAVVLAVTAFGAARAGTERTASPAQLIVATPSPTAAAPAPATPSGAREMGTDEPPLVLDLPTNADGHGGGTAGRGAKTKDGKPQRPKFLNTRE